MVTWSTSTPRSASSSSTSRYDSAKRRYQRTASTITSGGKQKPAKADRALAGERGRRVLMVTVCMRGTRSQQMQQRPLALPTPRQSSRGGRAAAPRARDQRPGAVGLRPGRPGTPPRRPWAAGAGRRGSRAGAHRALSPGGLVREADVVTTGVDSNALGVRAPTPPVVSGATPARFPARLPAAAWPATRQDGAQVLQRLTRAPFALESAGSQKQRRRGVVLLLAWLSEQPGASWQDRWLASGADAAGARWRQLPAQWLRDRSHAADGQHAMLGAALTVAICAEVVRPGLAWLVAAVP